MKNGLCKGTILPKWTHLSFWIIVVQYLRRHYHQEMNNRLCCQLCQCCLVGPLTQKTKRRNEWPTSWESPANSAGVQSMVSCCNPGYASLANIKAIFSCDAAAGSTSNNQLICGVGISHAWIPYVGKICLQGWEDSTANFKTRLTEAELDVEKASRRLLISSSDHARQWRQLCILMHTLYLSISKFIHI